jgi:phosphoserine phosphatase RsbX
VNGDRAFVRAIDDGVLVGVIDGLGHGPEAARAAALAVEALSAHPADGVVSLLEATHGALRGSRGCAATLVLARAGSVSIAGVGNVATHVFADTKIVHRPTPGIIGYSLPRGIRPLVVTALSPVRIVITSDGVSRRFELRDLDGLSAERACELLVERHSTVNDDATALVLDLFPAG